MSPIMDHPDWDFSERGKKDAERHRKKIDDVIRKNVKDVISEESIITKKRGRKVRIPVKGLKDYRFVYDYSKKGEGEGSEGDGVGQGKGKAGDVIGRRLKPGDKDGAGKPGNEPGEDYLETEVDIDYLIEIMFNDLGLPWIEEKTKARQLIPKGWKFDTISKKGIIPRLHKNRTMKEALKRTASFIGEIMNETSCTEDESNISLTQAKGDINKAIDIIKNGELDNSIEPYVYIEDDDLRYKQIDEDVELHSNAVVIAMMDTSGCYSEDTEVLTKRGWILFKDANNNDYFATRNSETKEFEWQKATDFISYNYNSELYNFYSDYIDLMVTPNHRMLINKRIKGEWQECILTAEELSKYSCSTKSGNYCIPTNSYWKGSKIKKRKFGDIEINGDDYCAFLGMYLSEGSLRRNDGRIVISQDKNSDAFEAFKSLLNKVCDNKINIWYSGYQFEIKWDEFCSYLSQFGTRAFNKIIPNDIMESTTEQIQIFWHYYWLGDGSRVSWRTDSIIYTTSKSIRDQLLELSQKIGFHANFSTDDRDLIGRIIKEKYIQKISHPCFRIVKYETNKTSFNVKKTLYNGKVYCVSVPNSILYVRRNGKTSWCGNSMTTDKKYLCRSLLFWLVEFLKKVYDNVQIKFITHTTDAKVVDEETFFKKGESGGTYCWSAFDKASYLIETEYPTNEWNVYCIYVSDGEDWETDKTVRYIKELLKKNINMLSYNEIDTDNAAYSTLWRNNNTLIKAIKDAWQFSVSKEEGTEFYKNTDEHFLLSVIKSKEHIYPCLRHILFKEGK